ncbi:acyl-ACP--UDP-N-acetylglucosamine O-acyltransferase [Trichothermofontia sp.]
MAIQATQATSIHATAVIEPGAQLGTGVTIGPFSYLDRDVVIGDRTVIGPQVAILAHTTVGADCQIHTGAVLGGVPQDFAFQHQPSYVHIGSHCVIREGVTVHRGTQAESVTKIGDRCLLMANSHLAHNVELGEQVIVANNALLAGYVQVGDRAFISGNCLIHQFVRIGRLAMLSGGTAVQQDVPPFCMTTSLSTNTVMGLNVVGLRRAGLSQADRQILKRVFRVLYRSNLNVSQALDRLETDFDSPLVTELCQFIRASKRGICHFIRADRP